MHIMEKSELAREIETSSKVSLEYIDFSNTYEGEYEEVYYVRDPSKKRMKGTMRLVVITSKEGSQSFVLSVEMTQVPSVSFHTHDQFMGIIERREEFPLDAITVREGSFEECMSIADVFLGWWKSFSNAQ